MRKSFILIIIWFLSVNLWAEARFKLCPYSVHNMDCARTLIEMYDLSCIYRSNMMGATKEIYKKGENYVLIFQSGEEEYGYRVDYTITRFFAAKLDDQYISCSSLGYQLEYEGSVDWIYAFISEDDYECKSETSMKGPILYRFSDPDYLFYRLVGIRSDVRKTLMLMLSLHSKEYEHSDYEQKYYAKDVFFDEYTLKMNFNDINCFKKFQRDYKNYVKKNLALN